ncbi:small multi-drug export protein [Lutibacter sp. B2]|nr:small multi-drug export protein [Lutibacter sp. B2]
MNQIMDIISKEIMVVVVAAMPLMELKGAIPLGISMGIDPVTAAILGVIGSFIPVPFLLLLLNPIFTKLRRNPTWRKWIDKIINRTVKKTEKIHKYKALGLLLFVAIPLPTTGVWTGSLAASLFRIPFVPAISAIFIGNCIAAFIMMTLSKVAVSL